MERKILVAIDGSAYSSNSLDYLIHLFPHDPYIAIHLLAVVASSGSEQSWMFDVDPLRKQLPVADKKTARAEGSLKRACRRLYKHGFSEEQVHCHTSQSRSTVATEIHQAAVHGQYDALVIGRRGLGKVGNMFFGSASSWLLEKCHEIPLWIIDGECSANRFLLAVHAIPESLLAADHLAFILQANPKAEILLYHSIPIFNGQKAPAEKHFHDPWGPTWCAEHLDTENYLFHAHAQILMEGGVAKKRITQLPMHRNIDPGRDLLHQAKKHKCGTIVMGRRGREVDSGIFGRVSGRATQNAQDVAIWIIG